MLRRTSSAFVVRVPARTGVRLTKRVKSGIKGFYSSGTSILVAVHDDVLAMQLSRVTEIGPPPVSVAVRLGSQNCAALVELEINRV